jgi:hypothetical protein
MTRRRRDLPATLNLEQIKMSVYQDNGYADRKAYLAELAQDYGPTVYILAAMLGPNEDFDGLITTLEDDEGNDFE